jgi:hypothetical protein
MRTGVVRAAEGTDDELARLDSRHRAADLDHHPAIFMAHMRGLVQRLGAAIRSEVRAADAGVGEFQDGVGGWRVSGSATSSPRL